MAFNIEDLKSELREMGQNKIMDFTILEEVDKHTFWGCVSLAEIKIIVNNKPAVIAVGFPNDFPHELPKFYDHNNIFGDIPHKMINGFLCFTRNDSLLIDSRRPESILLYCVDRVIKLVEIGMKGENKKDFVEEFEVYWGGVFTVHACIDTTNKKVRELNLWCKNINDDILNVATEKTEILNKTIFNLFKLDVKKERKYRCLYIPLKEGTFLFPPLHNKWSFSKLKENVLSNLSEQNKAQFSHFVKKPVKDISPIYEYVIIGLPKSNGEYSLFGCILNGNTLKLKSFKRKNKGAQQIHPFVLNTKAINFYQTKIKRWHPEYLLNRTGGKRQLKDKHVLIAGLGSVGSEVALRFAKAGVKKISLIDFDDMQFENIHRHALGMNSVYDAQDESIHEISKVSAMKAEINSKYPFTDVQIYLSDVVSFIDEGKISKEQIELIVIAIGSPNEEMRINQKLHDLPDAPPTIYSWVEPLGIGGHALVTLNGEKKGCLQCLFSNDVEKPLYNRSAFAEPGQDFSKSITGCGSVFIPYSFLDSERSAMLAVDTGIKLLIGNLIGNPILSWKGQDEVFISQGYKTTSRYTFTTEALNDKKHLYKNNNCIVCSD